MHRFVARFLAVMVGVVGFVVPTTGHAAEISIVNPYTVCSITSTTAVVCVPITGGNAQLVVGVVNNSATAQSATITCYDSGLNPTGPVAITIPPLGPAQVYSFPVPGRPLNNGLVCQSSGSILGTAVEIDVR